MWIKKLAILGVLVGAALRGESGAWASPLPTGSYQATCSDVRMSHGALTATCLTMNQQPRRSSLASIASCVGDIANIDGQLMCNRRRIPAGSYRQTCTGATMNGDTLSASCRTIDGRWVNTRLGAVRECTGDLANLDGTLSCSR
jgi:CVNH domain